MNSKPTRSHSLLYAMLLATVLYAATPASEASESDPWTYAYIPLADSAPQVSGRLALALESVIAAVNPGNGGERLDADDRSVEFRFFAEFQQRNIRELAWGMFERCIGTRSCDGWPEIERIQMTPEESVYHAADWRYIPSRLHLASIVKVCGVRMGADKLSHFFDDGFHYFNALRSRRKNLEPEDIRRLSMTFERTYMGTRMTGILSRADIEANLTGVRFYSDIFGGEAPMIGRGPDGRLVLLRKPDICDYVTPQYDERVLPNQFTYSMIDTERAETHARALLDIIAAREARASRLSRELDPADLALIKTALLSRRIPMTHWQSDFPKLRMLTYGMGMASQWLVDADFREVSNIFGFNPLKPGKLADRKPVRIKHVGLAYAGG
ncbi:MAG TPA: hypothetical protein VKB27_02205 [Gammaproteobacteria bacterium]|nr:hypothetical protein [Gammaproteobacteria bacterium]